MPKGMSSAEEELLRKTGIEAIVEQRDSAVRFECLRAAQRLRRSGCVTIGLLPASSEVGVVGAGVNLAIALAELTGSTIGYVDANMRWPALAPIAGEIGREHEEESDPHVDAPFSTRWLRGDVALLLPRRQTPGRFGHAGAGLVALSRLLVSANELFARSLVDLTGWKRLGEHLQAFSLLDGVMVVAQSGLTTEDELLRLNHEIPPDRNLGVLLLGADR